MAFPDMWSERCWVSFCKKGDSWQHFHTIISSVDIDEGDKPTTNVPNVGGGRMSKHEPQEDTVLTFEAYQVGIGTTTGDDLGLSQQYNSGTWDTDPYSTSPTHNRDLYKVAILFTNDTVANATEAIDGTHEAYRWTAIGAEVVSLKKSFTDKELKVTAQFRIPQFNKNGTANVTEESCSTSTELSAVSVYA
ncbi:MAG: hypothetical protein WC307_06690 [Candidatus Nanoarchaeia archaeon]|jgi:hypothetical protein